MRPRLPIKGPSIPHLVRQRACNLEGLPLRWREWRTLLNSTIEIKRNLNLIIMAKRGVTETMRKAR